MANCIMVALFCSKLWFPPQTYLAAFPDPPPPPWGNRHISAWSQKLSFSLCGKAMPELVRHSSNVRGNERWQEVCANLRIGPAPVEQVPFKGEFEAAKEEMAVTER